MELNKPTYIYTSSILGSMYTLHPMMKFDYSTYVSLDAVKHCMGKEEFKELKAKLRGYNCKINKDDKAKI